MFVCVCVFVCVRRLTSLLDKGGAVQNFVDSLQQLTNPEMLFKVIWFMVYDMVRLVSQQHIRVSGSASLELRPSNCPQDWWEDVKNELEKPDFDKDKMARLYKEMQASLGNTRAEGCGSFRKKFSQVGLVWWRLVLARGFHLKTAQLWFSWSNVYEIQQQ